jgi:hypothetical protein
MYEYLRGKFETRDEMQLYVELETELTKLDPINWEDGYKFLAEVERLNNCIRVLDVQNAKNETQLKIFVYTKIYKPDIGAISAWSSFLDNFNKTGALSRKKYEDFKEEFCNHWKFNGNPGNVSNKISKAMNVNSTMKCYNCGKLRSPGIGMQVTKEAHWRFQEENSGEWSRQIRCDMLQV